MHERIDYTELDGALMDAIRSGTSNFTALCYAPTIKRAAHALEMAGPRDRRGDRKPAWRFIDNRLQALRKAGKIVYSRKTEWSMSHAG